MTVHLVESRTDGAASALLIAELRDDLASRYEGMGSLATDWTQFIAPGGGFLVAELDGAAVGCAGFRAYAPLTCELKRMYVRPAARGRGVARALLRGVEQRAAAAGYTRIILETGTAQPEAIGLYVSAGYERVPQFGEYADEPDSRCFGRTLAPPP
jgi:GNAT superfamily N-acetyltransferase